MIGTGIFTSLGFQVGALPSASTLLFLWFFGGVIALCGGLSYINLAKNMPESGGEYHYISKNYSTAFSWFAAAVSIFAGFAAPIALACMAFAAYVGGVFSVNAKCTAIALLSLVTLFHCLGSRVSSHFQIIFTALKVFVLLLIIWFGLNHPFQANAISFSKDNLNLMLSKPFAISLVYVSFAYSGWNACVYIFKELQHAVSTIKMAVVMGVVIVTALYMLVTWVFLKVIPLQQLNGVVEVGALAAKQLFGVEVGSYVASVMAMLLVSTISSMVWISPRVIAKLAEDKNLPLMAKQTNGIPLNAIILQYVIVLVMILTSTFQLILVYSALLMNICSILSVITLFKRKAKFRALICPTVFTIATFWSTVHLLVQLVKPEF